MAENTVTQNVSDNDVELINNLRGAVDNIRAELSRVIIGQDDVVEKLLICIMARGHALLVGVPGLAKTLLIKSLSDTLSLSFSRIQFTPDLMPSDITGTDILQETDVPGRRAYEFVKGPLFANIVLADEINRTPPKTQAALLQAMQEQVVNAGSHVFELDKPFFVLATQNPIEQEGTYPLPEAQLDRFMFRINVGYPTAVEEGRIARETTSGSVADLQEVLSGDDILAFQDVVRRVPVADHVYDYAVALVRMSRPGTQDAPPWINDLVQWGAGPRAVQNLILGAKARCVLHGRYLAQIEDIDMVADPVLSHRILTNFHAESEGIRSNNVVEMMIEELHKHI